MLGTQPGEFSHDVYFPLLLRIDQIMIVWIMPFTLANHDSYCSQYSEVWPFPILAPSTDPDAISTRWGNDEAGVIDSGEGVRGGEIRRQIFVSTAGGCRRVCGCASCMISLSPHAVPPTTEFKHWGAFVGSCSFQTAIHSPETSSAPLVLPFALCNRSLPIL
jgi:hypothetical protein